VLPGGMRYAVPSRTSGDTMKVTLAYPPDRNLPTVPFASLPQLAGPLRKGGHEVVIHDVNAEVFRTLLTRERLLSFYDFAEAKLAEVESKPFAALSADDRRWYPALIAGLAPARERFERIEQSIAVMKDPVRFYEPAAFNQAYDDLFTAIRFLFLPSPYFDPATWTFVDDVLAALPANVDDFIGRAMQEKVIERILADGSGLVALSITFSIQFFEAMKFCALLKRRAPHVKILVGGQTVNDFRDRLFADARLFQLFDYAIIGEGENAIVKLADALDGRCRLDEVPNLYWVEQGELRKSTLPHDLVDLNEVPGPDFDGFDFDLYLLPERVVSFQSSRGCYYGKCAFCGDAYRRNFRMRAPERVVEDVKQIHERQGVTKFLFWDSLAPPRTLRRIAEMIAAEHLPIEWFAETKFEKPYLKDALVDSLARGGCRFLQLGFESGSQRVLNMIDKGNDLAEVEVQIDNFRRHGIQLGLSWFVGFPQETVEEAQSSLDFMIDHRDVVGLVNYGGPFFLGEDNLVFQNPGNFGIRIVRGPKGEIDYEYEDGRPHTDWGPMNQVNMVRSDWQLLIYSAQILYSSNAPEKLFSIQGMGRYGPPARLVPDLAEQRVRRTEGLDFRRFRYRAAADGTLVDEPVRMAYVPRPGHRVELTPVQERIVAAADGRKSSRDIAAELGSTFDALAADFARLVDLGLLRCEYRTPLVGKMQFGRTAAATDHRGRPASTVAPASLPVLTR
jgi:radical SAM superfamily enzyme YgiQ (UPF0313 family)